MNQFIPNNNFRNFIKKTRTTQKEKNETLENWEHRNKIIEENIEMKFYEDCELTAE